jgi:hypothetical protein
MPPDSTRKTLTLTRRFLLGLLVAGLVGTGMELLLMGHTDGLSQLIPLLLIGITFLTLGWYAIGRSVLSLYVFRIVMLLSAVSGVAGSLLHYLGNVEFETEMTPGLAGFDLFKEAIRGATPALAPGTMILLGALGLLYTLRHPAFRLASTQIEEP